MGEYQGLAAPVKLSRTPARYRFAPLSEGQDFLPGNAARSLPAMTSARRERAFFWALK